MDSHRSAILAPLSDHKRLVLIISLLVVLLGIATFFFVFLLTELNERKDFSAKQLLGTEYLKPLFTFERDLLAYRHAFLSKQDVPFNNDILSLQRQVDSDIQVIDETDRKLGAALSTTATWENIKKDSLKLRHKTLQPLSSQAIGLHAALMTDVTSLISRVGDRSNLILDPDLDSYYLAETLVNRLPVLIDQLEQVRIRTPRTATASPPASHERSQLSNDAKLIHLTQQAIAHNLTVASGSMVNSVLRSQLALAAARADKAIDHLLALMDSTGERPLTAEQQRRMAAASGETLLASAQLFAVGLEALTDTIQTRIDGIAQKKILIEAVAAITTLIVISLFIAFRRSHRERELAEKELRAQESRLRAIVQGALDAVVTMDSHGAVVEWNPQAEIIFGFSRQDAVGKLLSDLIIPPQYREAHAKGMQRFLSTGEETILRKRIEIAALRKNGEEFPVELAVIPLRLGEQTLFSSFIRDITAAKEAEAALLQGQMEVQRASQAKSDFLATVSHEMRTPLNAIVGIADYLAQTPLSPEQLTLVKRCTKASDSLLRIIEDLLQAAKAESGTLDIVETPFPLPEIVSECTLLLSTEAQDKGLTLTLHLEPDLPAHVLGDAQRLQQVLLNLIRNAIKFTPAGTVDVRVRPLFGQDQTCKVQFSVSDTGIGISPEQQARLFQRFVQADSRSNRQFGGVGLGLSISKQLVELMQGRIWVDSQKGHGSTFSFIIPFTVLDRPSAQPPRFPSIDRSPSAAATTGTDQAERHLRILLAEDSIESQEVVQLYLRSTPHHLDIASTGRRALTLFKAESYDLVLMDLNMPEMDGFTAIKLIRAYETEQGRRSTPIVALTANGLLETQQESFKAGCNGFLTKPIKMDMLLQAIRQYSGKPPASEPAAPSTASAGNREAVASELAQLKSKFLRNRHGDIATLEAAITAAHFDQIKTIGHRIKGLAGSYGLHEIGAIGSVLEQAAIDRDISTVTIHVAKLRDAVHEAETTAKDDSGLTSHAA